jgi:hypothetical protein
MLINSQHLAQPVRPRGMSDFAGLKEPERP